MSDERRIHGIRIIESEAVPPGEAFLLPDPAFAPGPEATEEEVAAWRRRFARIISGPGA